MLASALLLPVLALAGSASAALQIVRPGTASWWVANSLNTVQWIGLDPPIFAISVYNSNITLLSSGSAVLNTQNNAFDLSYTLTPFLNVGSGYSITLHNVSDPTDVFAKSETFEVRPQGTAYPPLITALPSSSSSAASSTGADANSSPSSSAAASTTTTSSTSAGDQAIVAPGLSKNARLLFFVLEAVACLYGFENLMI